ncbi:Hypothetical protein POVN_LOCUS212 [uncultured virus]|nr:Hypothetical protein POVN_LOCUS212 [uncultured virus]
MVDQNFHYSITGLDTGCPGLYITISIEDQYGVRLYEGKPVDRSDNIISNTPVNKYTLDQPTNGALMRIEVSGSSVKTVTPDGHHVQTAWSLTPGNYKLEASGCSYFRVRSLSSAGVTAGVLAAGAVNNDASSEAPATSWWVWFIVVILLLLFIWYIGWLNKYPVYVVIPASVVTVTT